jgi:hypothetical protein
MKRLSTIKIVLEHWSAYKGLVKNCGVNFLDVLLTLFICLGPFQNDNKHGKGTLTYSNGDKYEGMFENGKRHGKGTYTFKNGGRRDGIYNNDRRVHENVSTKPTTKTTSRQYDQATDNRSTSADELAD